MSHDQYIPSQLLKAQLFSTIPLEKVLIVHLLFAVILYNTTTYLDFWKNVTNITFGRL